MVAVASAAAATAFGLLTRFLLRELRPTAALFGVLVALPLTAPHILARPHMLALPLLVAWIAALIRSVDTRTAPSWLLLPLMTLWANLHGSFTFGLAMIGAAGAEALFRAKPAERMNVVRQWGSFGVLALPRLPQSVRSRDDPGDFPHRGARLGARNDHRMAAAGLQPYWQLRDHYAGRVGPGALSRRQAAALQNSHAAWRPAPEPVACPPRRSAGDAGADIPGAAAGKAVHGSFRGSRRSGAAARRSDPGRTRVSDACRHRTVGIPE